MGEVLLFIQLRHMPNNICNVNIFKYLDEGRRKMKEERQKQELTVTEYAASEMKRNLSCYFPS